MGRKRDCSRCGGIKEDNRLNTGYCKECYRVRGLERRAKFRATLATKPKKERSATCNDCGAVKENIVRPYCYSCRNKRERAYKNSPAVIARVDAKQRQLKLQYERYRNDDDFKRKCEARSAVKNAVRDGYLIRGDCEVCGISKNIQGHHEDYTKPLEVIWLCISCHRGWHMCRDMEIGIF